MVWNGNSVFFFSFLALLAQEGYDISTELLVISSDALPGAEISGKKKKGQNVKTMHTISFVCNVLLWLRSNKDY